ncbi:MAG: aldehyde dehydrogenase (NADP(+)) [Pseudomonadota bacterium]
MNLYTEIDQAVSSACQAAAAWARSDGPMRASLLESLAHTLEQNRAGLVNLADAETRLGAPRLNGELDRTAFQLRGFADHARLGLPFSSITDAAVAGPPPQGKPQITRVRVPLGPVAMFSASNFPFAFSVLGGDTASALAAGCPVVVKAHPAHPALSRAVFSLAQDVLAGLELPAGLMTHIDMDSYEAGLQLVAHPGIQAVAFTGSLAGGQALARQIQSRAQPIPFYGELGSVNPVIVLPDALQNSIEDQARLLAQSITQGAGQFCTCPGLVLMLNTPGARTFAHRLAREVDQIKLHPMLSARIHEGFNTGVARLASHADVEVLTGGQPAAELKQRVHGFVGLTSATAFLAHQDLRHEVFGASCLCVLADSMEQIQAVLLALGGSLTVTIWGADTDTKNKRELFRSAQSMAGRILFKGVPTGVAVTHAQHHGGPWPASTQPLFTSVGFTACDRFLRPLALQDAPAWLTEAGGIPI